jgi:DNA-binding IclR family transcriptional regulator
MPERESEKMIREIKLDRHTDRTITSKEKLRKEIKAIRKRGWSTDVSEIMEGIHCVGAPVFGRDNELAGAVWVVAPSVRLPEKMFKTTAEIVIDHAERISASLGFRGSSS